jgi:hypothetical protein
VRDLKKVKYSASISLKLLPSMRMAIETLGEREAISLGEAARELLQAGIQAKGIKFRGENYDQG